MHSIKKYRKIIFRNRAGSESRFGVSGDNNSNTPSLTGAAANTVADSRKVSTTAAPPSVSRKHTTNRDGDFLVGGAGDVTQLSLQMRRLHDELTRFRDELRQLHSSVEELRVGFSFI